MAIADASLTEIAALAPKESIESDFEDKDSNIKDKIVPDENGGEEEIPAEIPEKEPEKPAAPKAALEAKPVDDYKAEIVKRFGEKPDEQLVPEVWKSYREMEKEFDRRNVLTKEVLETVDKFGGLEALKQILATPKEALKKEVVADKPASKGNDLPADIQQLIDTGELDPDNLKDRMLIRQELAIREQERTKAQDVEAVQTAKQQEAVQTFKTFLKDEISPKYEYADLAAIEAKAYAGAWRGLSDAAFKVAVENEAKELHDRVLNLANKTTEEKIAEFRKVANKSATVGKAVSKPANSKKMSFRESFDKAYAENFGNRN